MSKNSNVIRFLSVRETSRKSSVGNTKKTDCSESELNACVNLNLK